MADVEHGRRHLHGRGGEQLRRRCRRTAVVHARAHRAPPGHQRGEQLRRDAAGDERHRARGPGRLRPVHQTRVVGLHQTGAHRVHRRRTAPERFTGQDQS